MTKPKTMLNDSVTCAGCGATTVDPKTLPAKGREGQQPFCPECRTEPGHAWLSKPVKLERRKRGK